MAQRKRSSISWPSPMGPKPFDRDSSPFFGMAITLILDWYHLEKKVTGLMSIIAINKQEKELHVAFLCQHLWRGKVQEVVQYLSEQVRAKNVEKLFTTIHFFSAKW